MGWYQGDCVEAFIMVQICGIFELYHRNSLILDVISYVFPTLYLNMAQRKIGEELTQDKELACDHAII